MLDLRSASSVCERTHEKFIDDDLPEAVSHQAFAAFDRSRFDEAEVSVARENWQRRVLDEFRSQTAFTELLGELTRLRAPFDILGSAIRVVRDENRHVMLCRRMVHALGGDDCIPGEPMWVLSDKTVSLKRRVAQTVVDSLCVGETISVRLLRAARQWTTDALPREAMTVLVSDEAFHARFGWAVLEFLLPHLKADEREALEDRLPPLFAAIDALMTQKRLPHASHQSPNAFGLIPAEMQADVYRDALREDVVDRFKALGFGTRHF